MSQITENVKTLSWAIESSTWFLQWAEQVVQNVKSKSILENITTSFSSYFDASITYLNSFWPKLVWAILVLWIGFKIINILNQVIKNYFKKTNIDPMIKTFSISLISILLKIAVFLSAAWMLWVQTTSFLALFTAAWVAIGMSLSGTLQNFAGWIIIMAFKLYKIGDFISIWANEWTVKWIYIFHTIILSQDRKTIIIPNSQISNWTMVNFSTEEIRRQDMSVWVSYDSDIDLVKQVLREMAEADERILKTDDYKVNVFVNELRASDILVTVRFFVESKNLLAVKWEINENILKTCKKNNITIPFPQTDIFIKNK